MNPIDDTFVKRTFIQLLLSTLFLSILIVTFEPSVGSGRPFSSTYRCLSICRRDEETLCKRCLFREPMRFGKRQSSSKVANHQQQLFREPMRFGKKNSNNNANFRPMMRFGKKDQELFSGPADNFNDDSGSMEAAATILQPPQPQQQRSRLLAANIVWNNKFGQTNPDMDISNNNNLNNNNNDQGPESSSSSLVWQLIPPSSSKAVQAAAAAAAAAAAQSSPPSSQSPSSSSYSSMSNENQ